MVCFCKMGRMDGFDGGIVGRSTVTVGFRLMVLWKTFSVV